MVPPDDARVSAGVLAGPARFLAVSPTLRWLARWMVSIASLVGGVLTLFVFRRGLPHVGWIIGYLLLLWLLFAVLTQVRHALLERGHRFVVSAANYTIQTLYHGLLLFVLPAYWASTTVTSPNVVFLVALAMLALITTIDPWYRALVQPRPWLGVAFFLLSIFSALNVALPLVGLPPPVALLVSAAVAVLASAPAVRRAGRGSWAHAFGAVAAGALVAMFVVNVGRAWIPPAPLTLGRTVLGWDVGSVESLEPIAQAIRASELRERGLVAYTAVVAPAGLRQPIVHVWRRDGLVVDVVRLSPIYGGRREGFRTHSRKTSFPDNPVGRWAVDVRTGSVSGQLVGRLEFRVVP